MARMYPKELLVDDVKSRAERELFAEFRDQLPDDWHVFHSAGWIHRDPKRGARVGEIDFVLCQPDRGVVCIEVKGGGIKVEGSAWFRRVKGEWQRMKDPSSKRSITQRVSADSSVSFPNGGSIGR